MGKPAAKEHLVLGNGAALIRVVPFCRAEPRSGSLWSMKLRAMAAHGRSWVCDAPVLWGFELLGTRRLEYPEYILAFRAHPSSEVASLPRKELVPLGN